MKIVSSVQLLFKQRSLYLAFFAFTLGECPEGKYTGGSVLDPFGLPPEVCFPAIKLKNN